MTTTFEKYAGTRLQNYCSRPTIDVEILPRVLICADEDCEAPDLAYIAPGWAPPREGERDVYRPGGYVHEEGGRFDHTARPAPQCTYCGADDTHLTSKQHAWYDAIECSRCGGVQGWALGD
jgi:hypothetical protein